MSPLSLFLLAFLGGVAAFATTGADLVDCDMTPQMCRDEKQMCGAFFSSSCSSPDPLPVGCERCEAFRECAACQVDFFPQGVDCPVMDLTCCIAYYGDDPNTNGCPQTFTERASHQPTGVDSTKRDCFSCGMTQAECTAISPLNQLQSNFVRRCPAP